MQSSSKPCRAWLLQSGGKYFDVVIKCLGLLRKTDYFNKFYVATNRIKAPTTPSYCNPIWLKQDFGWSDNIINALAYVKEKTFFMGCEDHLLVDFDEELVELAFGLVQDGMFGCIRLTRKPQIKTTEVLGVLPIDKSYRYLVSCQPTIWNKDYLESIIRPGETAWQFEILASQRARKLNIPVGVTYKTAFNYRNLIDKGKLVEDPKTYTEVHGT